ncbi:hypothetical protein PG996_013655 [Apiospora saccharicola]|uniref:F-box domain-containing protein n=1 Tax=Apiospora saccharicola TaxID=335842 RepID=A0ABR1U627_9PEZI
MDESDQPPKPPKSWETAPSPQAKSLLMTLPLDLLKVIADHLSPVCAAALSVTCQAALAVFELKSPLYDSQRTALRRQLERDLGTTHYFCWKCRQLHRHAKDWRVHWNHYKSSEWPRCRRDPDDLRELGAWCFGFHHFQLVMNEHYYGPGKGLPVASFMEPGHQGVWQIRPTIAVIKDQCFLSVRYVLSLTGTRKVNEAAVSRCPNLRFCNHIDMDWDVWDTHHTTGARERGLPERRRSVRDWFVSELGREEQAKPAPQGYCRACLTDYKLEWKRHPHPHRSGKIEMVEIEFVTYHQLGACRDPEDWMWKAFISRRPFLDRDTSYGFGEFCHCPPGEVKKSWDTAHEV